MGSLRLTGAPSWLLASSWEDRPKLVTPGRGRTLWGQGCEHHSKPPGGLVTELRPEGRVCVNQHKKGDRKWVA